MIGTSTRQSSLHSADSQSKALLTDFIIRLVSPGELNELYELHSLVIEKLPSSQIFRRDSRKYMARLLGERGVTIGCFHLGRLVAYASVSFPGWDEANLGYDLDRADLDMAMVANCDGSAVHPDYRGYGLQHRLSVERENEARRRGCRHICATVSPYNPPSLRNFFLLGMRVCALKAKYDGMLRYVFYAELGHDNEEHDEGHTDVRCSDIETQKMLLHHGYCGVQLIDRSGAFYIRMVARRAALADDGMLPLAA